MPRHDQGVQLAHQRNRRTGPTGVDLGPEPGDPQTGPDPQAEPFERGLDAPGRLALGQPRWAIFSAATGALFLAAFLGTGAAAVPVMGLVAAVALAWAWLSATSAKLIAEDARSTAIASRPLTGVVRPV